MRKMLFFVTICLIPACTAAAAGYSQLCPMTVHRPDGGVTMTWDCGGNVDRNVDGGYFSPMLPYNLPCNTQILFQDPTGVAAASSCSTGQWSTNFNLPDAGLGYAVSLNPAGSGVFAWPSIIWQTGGSFGPSAFMMFDGTTVVDSKPFAAPFVDAGIGQFNTAAITTEITVPPGNLNTDAAQYGQLRPYATPTAYCASSVVGATQPCYQTVAPSAGVPYRFDSWMAAGTGAGNYTVSLYDSTTSTSICSFTLACTASGYQSYACGVVPNWNTGDLLQVRIDDSACATAPIGPIGMVWRWE